MGRGLRPRPIYTPFFLPLAAFFRAFNAYILAKYFKCGILLEASNYYDPQGDFRLSAIHRSIDV